MIDNQAKIIDLPAIVPDRRNYSIPVVYLIVNKINGKIYVGSTINFYTRYLNYRKKSNCSNSTQIIMRAIKKYGFNNFDFKILELLDFEKELRVEIKKEKLLSREQYWLDRLNPFDPVGYNLAKIAGSNLGIKHSLETRRKFSLAQKGKKISEDAKKRMSESGGEPVYQINKNTLEIVNEFKSAKAAAEYINGNHSGICNVCRGLKYSAYGFYWVYKKDYTERGFIPLNPKVNMETPLGKPKKIVQIDIRTLEIINTFISASEAQRKFDKDSKLVQMAARRDISSAYGYYWMYEEEYLEKGFIRRVDKRVFGRGGRLNVKPIYQLDLNGNIIKIWTRISDVYEKYNYSIGNISMACKHNKIAYGFKWKFIKDVNIINNIKKEIENEFIV